MDQSFYPTEGGCGSHMGRPKGSCGGPGRPKATPESRNLDSMLVGVRNQLAELSKQAKEVQTVEEAKKLSDSLKELAEALPPAVLGPDPSDDVDFAIQKAQKAEQKHFQRVESMDDEELDRLEAQLLQQQQKYLAQCRPGPTPPQATATASASALLAQVQAHAAMPAMLLAHVRAQANAQAQVQGQAQAATMQAPVAVAGPLGGPAQVAALAAPPLHMQQQQQPGSPKPHHLTAALTPAPPGPSSTSSGASSPETLQPSQLLHQQALQPQGPSHTVLHLSDLSQPSQQQLLLLQQVPTPPHPPAPAQGLLVPGFAYGSGGPVNTADGGTLLTAGVFHPQAQAYLHPFGFNNSFQLHDGQQRPLQQDPATGYGLMQGASWSPLFGSAA